MHVKRIILLNVEDIAEPGPGTEQSADKHGENFGGEEGQSNESKIYCYMDGWNIAQDEEESRILGILHCFIIGSLFAVATFQSTFSL